MDRIRRKILGIALGAIVLHSVSARAADNRWSKNPLDLTGAAVGDPVTPGVLYARSAQGLVRSADNGMTWIPLGFDALPLAVGPPDTIYAGRVLESPGDERLTQIFKTTDRGAHWVLLYEVSSHALAPTAMPSIFVDQRNPAFVYRIDVYQISRFCPDAHLLRRSTDGGQTWSQASLGFETGHGRVNGLALDPSTAGTVYVSIQPLNSVTCPTPSTAPAAIYKSTDAGGSWTTLPNGPAGASALAVDPQAPNTVYAARDGVLFRSLDSGATFEQRSSLATFLTELVVDPAHSDRLYAVSPDEGVFASADSGSSWTTINAGLEGFPAHLIVDPTGAFLHTSPALFDYHVVHAPSVLSLDPGRAFQVTLRATNPLNGESATGLATIISPVAGFFSLPKLTNDPANPEVFVKILDGRGVTGAWWVFYGGLTSFEYTLTVTDETSGQTMSYTKPAGSACGGFDTQAFPLL